jgi:hypothetical protein
MTPVPMGCISWTTAREFAIDCKLRRPLITCCIDPHAHFFSCRSARVILTTSSPPLKSCRAPLTRPETRLTIPTVSGREEVAHLLRMHFTIFNRAVFRRTLRRSGDGTNPREGRRGSYREVRLMQFLRATFCKLLDDQGEVRICV